MRISKMTIGYGLKPSRNYNGTEVHLSVEIEVGEGEDALAIYEQEKRNVRNAVIAESQGLLNEVFPFPTPR